MPQPEQDIPEQDIPEQEIQFQAIPVQATPIQATPFQAGRPLVLVQMVPVGLVTVPAARGELQP